MEIDNPDDHQCPGCGGLKNDGCVGKQQVQRRKTSKNRFFRNAFFLRGKGIMASRFSD